MKQITAMSSVASSHQRPRSNLCLNGSVGRTTVSFINQRWKGVSAPTAHDSRAQKSPFCAVGARWVHINHNETWIEKLQDSRLICRCGFAHSAAMPTQVAATAAKGAE
ncbi:MAG: hypothetical protein JNL39_06790 [Opitutaceae bacterium]|nr:hypothetical protein [Opitutaceae bacterium]